MGAPPAGGGILIPGRTEAHGLDTLVDTPGGNRDRFRRASDAVHRQSGCPSWRSSRSYTQCKLRRRLEILVVVGDVPVVILRQFQQTRSASDSVHRQSGVCSCTTERASTVQTVSKTAEIPQVCAQFMEVVDVPVVVQRQVPGMVQTVIKP